MTHLSTGTGLAATRRTADPFVFRSGGFFGSGKTVRSIRAAIRHMDRYPEDGIYHLRNGTLAQWLDAQSAEELARLAREVMRSREPDPRVTLEKFLIGAGLVRRPRLALRPKAMTLRYILAGQQAECLLRVRKGRGRGYLFGVLHASQPWIRIDPARFSGKPIESVVSVATESLPISATPHAGEILVESSATAEPISVPLRFKVVGVPSEAQRWLVRPLISLILAAALGALLGALIAFSGMGFPTQPLARLGLSVTPLGAWAALVGLVWGIFGLILGVAQPLAWPIWYANGRWLLRTLIWAATFTMLAAIGLVTWRVAYPGGHVPFYAPGRAALWFVALALSIFPAALGEMWSFHTTRGRTVRLSQQPLLRAGLLVLIAGILAVILIVGIRLVGPTIERIDVDRALQTTESFVDEQWVRFEGSMNRLVDDLTIRFYDRRAKP
jgi:hypothetical protein